MPIPAVSEYNWKRTQAVATLTMGTDELDPSVLSFGTQLETIIGWFDGLDWNSFHGILREHIEPSTQKHVHAKLDTPYRARVRLDDRDRPHRPEISDEVASRITEQVRREHPDVPAEELDFDTQLDIVLNAAEEYFNELDCEIHFTRNT